MDCYGAHAGLACFGVSGVDFGFVWMLYLPLGGLLGLECLFCCGSYVRGVLMGVSITCMWWQLLLCVICCCYCCVCITVLFGDFLLVLVLGVMWFGYLFVHGFGTVNFLEWCAVWA